MKTHAFFVFLCACASFLPAQTCRVQCPDGSSVIADCDSSEDPCAGNSGGGGGSSYSGGSSNSSYSGPSADTVLNNQGAEYYKAGDWTRAIEAFKAALAINPNDPVVLKNLSNAEQAQSDEQNRAAVAELRRLNDASQVQKIQEIVDGAGLAKASPPPALGGLEFSASLPSRTRLKPMENPLRKEAKAGDSVGVTARFESWGEAAACAGTAARDSGSGKIVCCRPGFPYYCSGRCYSAEAFNSLRVPCGSTIKTEAVKK